MAGIGLSRALNGDTLRRFASLATQSQSPAAALRGPLGQDQAITSGLRIGARTFAAALDGLNGAVSLVNLSQKALEDLSTITDKLIDVTRRATDVATSTGTRGQLDIEFKRLAGDFRRTVKNATTGDNEFLTKEGLEEIFSTIGLDKKSSASIAQVFSRFVTPLADDSLASEKVAADHVQIPVGAFRTREADSAHVVDVISHEETRSGAISTVNGVYSSPDTVTGQNPGYYSLITGDTNGSQSGLAAGSISADVTLLAVNETSGYSIISSNADFLGYNAGNFEQLFLVDNTGNVIQQFTDNSSGGASYRSADMSSDSKTIAWIQSDAAVESTVRHVTVSSFGTDPGTLTSTTIFHSGVPLETLESIKISNSGDYIAFRDLAAVSLAMYQVSTTSFSPGAAGFSSTNSFGFVDDGILAIADSGGTVTALSFGGVGLTYEIDVSSISNFSTLEGSGFAFFDSTDAKIKRYDNGGNLQDTVQLNPTDGSFSLSLALNRDGSSVDMGIIGNISALGGNGENQLYRVRSNPAYSNGVRSSAATPDAYDSITGEQKNSIFDESRSIANRGQAFRTLDDLYALKDQLKSNISALDGARQTLGDNIKLVRSTGLAFLEAADQVRNSIDAEKLAENLRQRIRDSAPTALSQAENLNPLVVAALTHGGY